MAGKGGGAWKVAYADFVTAMMAFFLVMWIVAQNKPVKKAVANYFNDPFSVSLMKPRDETSNPRTGGRHKGVRGPGNRAGEVYTSDVSNLEDKPDFVTKQPSLVVLRQGSRTSVGAALVFEGHDAQLTPAHEARLMELIPLLLGKPQKIEIRGHSSREPLPDDSPYEDFWHVAYARCVATRDFLEKQGIEPERMRMCQAGAFEPVTLKVEGPQAKLNSRVEIVMLAEFAEDLQGSKEEREHRERPAAAGKH